LVDRSYHGRVDLPPYTFRAALGHWSFDPVVAGVLVLVGAAYVALWVSARRRGQAWPGWRVALFLVVGLGSVVVCTMSSLATYAVVVMPALAAQLTLLIAIAPYCLGLGDPIGLLRVGLPPRGARRVDGALNGPVMRVLAFPAVAAALSLVVMMVVFFSGLLAAALASSAVMDAVYLLVLATGCLFALPLMGGEVLPAWCTGGFRLLFAVVDGIFDAIPGLAVLATSTALAGGYYVHVAAPDWVGDTMHSQHIAGAVMIAVSEVVSLPLVVTLFFLWAVNETGRDAADVRAEVAARPEGPGGPGEEPVLERPWWETEGYSRRRTEEYRPKR
jgi:putative copper resistance protein D